MKKIFSTFAAAAVLAAGLAIPAQADGKPDNSKYTTEHYLKLWRKSSCTAVESYAKYGTYSNAMQAMNSMDALMVPAHYADSPKGRRFKAQIESIVLRAVECGYLKDDRNSLGQAAGSFDKIFGGSSLSS